MRLLYVLLAVVCCQLGCITVSAHSHHDIISEVSEPRRKVSSYAREQFKELAANTVHLGNRIAFMANPKHAGLHDSHADQLLGITRPIFRTHNPLMIAENLQTALPDILEMAMEDDAFCSRKALIDVQGKVIGLMNTLINVSSVTAELARKAQLDRATEVEPIRAILRQIEEDTNKHIDHFENRCWSDSRIESIIAKIVSRYRAENATTTAAEVIDVLSKWHTNDKFVVIARGKQCEDKCSFQEAFRYEDDRVVSFHGVTVIRTRTSITESGRAKIQRLIEINARARWTDKCIDAGNYFIDNLKTLGYIAIHDAKCAPVIRSTHSDALFSTDLAFDDASGAKKQFRATMVFKCYRNVTEADGSFIPVCDI